MKDDPQIQRVAAEHARCWNLIPWWVNGTLSSGEASGVELHVAACTECAAELALQRALHVQLRDGDPVLMAPQSAWQKMAERLDNEDEALARGHFKLRPKKVGTWQWAVAAQALIIVGLAAVVWQQARSPDSAATQRDTLLQPRYETLTSASSTVVASRSIVRVVFRSDVAVVDINALLHTLPAQISAGPTEAGVYTLTLPMAQQREVTQPGQAGDLLTRLRADARVIFAEPSEVRPDPHSQPGDQSHSQSNAR